MARGTKRSDPIVRIFIGPRVQIESGDPLVLVVAILLIVAHQLVVDLIFLLVDSLHVPGLVPLVVSAERRDLLDFGLNLALFSHLGSPGNLIVVRVSILPLIGQIAVVICDRVAGGVVAGVRVPQVMQRH